MIEKISKLSGYIVEVPGHAFNRNDFSAIKNIEFTDKLMPGWEVFSLSSQVPFRNEDILHAKPPYFYPIVVRRSGNRAMLVSTTRRAIDELINKELIRTFGYELIKLKINVDEMVRGIVALPGDYALSHVHAMLSFGSELRSASFYGDDLGEARFLRSNLGLMNFTSCGLKRLNADHEILKIGYDGYLSFYFRGIVSLKAVEGALKYLSASGYLPIRMMEDI